MIPGIRSQNLDAATKNREIYRVVQFGRDHGDAIGSNSISPFYLVLVAVSIPRLGSKWNNSSSVTAEIKKWNYAVPEGVSPYV